MILLKISSWNISLENRNVFLKFEEAHVHICPSDDLVSLVLSCVLLNWGSCSSVLFVFYLSETLNNVGLTA